MLQRVPAPRRSGAPIAVAVFVVVAGVVAPSFPVFARGSGRGTAAKAKTPATRSSKKTAKTPKTPPAPPRPQVIPDQQGKVVMFPFEDDDDNSVFAQIERLLRSRGLEVMTGVRPVDTAEQYRDMATTMDLVAYVDGSYGERGDAARVTVRVRSGYTGRRVALTTFRETRLHLRAEIEEKLWTKIGPAMARACADAAKPRKRGRGPLLIDAGTPIATDNAQAR